MKRLLLCIVSIVCAVAAQEVPQPLRGKWVVKRVVPTETISCWGENEAKHVIGTQLEYTRDSLRWNAHVVRKLTVVTKVVTAQQFAIENSGQGASSSQVSFQQLGIRAGSARQVELNHPAVNVAAGTPEMPGDTVLIKNRNTILFSVCNLYFEARRVNSTQARR